MNELNDSASLNDVQSEVALVTQRVLQCAYLSIVEGTYSIHKGSSCSPIYKANYEGGKFRFAGRTTLNDSLVLFTVGVDRSTGKCSLTINSENTVLNAMLLK